MAEKEVPVQAQKDILQALRAATQHGPAAAETLVQFTRIAEARKAATTKATPRK